MARETYDSDQTNSGWLCELPNERPRMVPVKRCRRRCKAEHICCVFPAICEFTSLFLVNQTAVQKQCGLSEINTVSEDSAVRWRLASYKLKAVFLTYNSFSENITIFR